MLGTLTAAEVEYGIKGLLYAGSLGELEVTAAGQRITLVMIRAAATLAARMLEAELARTEEAGDGR